MNTILNIIIGLFFASGLNLAIQLGIIINKRIYEFGNTKKGFMFNLLPTLNYWIKVSPTDLVRKKVILLKKSYILNLILLVAFIISMAIKIIQKA